jgi:prolipoprotein diacylglyceryltransferase
MTIDIAPGLFGSALLTWTGLFTTIGTVAGIAMMVRWASVLRIGQRDAFTLGLRVTLWSLAGARLLHVIEFADFYSQVPFQALYLWQGGLALWGALIGGTAGALWHARRRGLALGPFSDRLALAGLAAMAFARIGDLISGARPGNPMSLPWGVKYVHQDAAAYADGAAVHPVAAYELLLGVALLAALVWLVGLAGKRRLQPDGVALVVAFAGYAAGRFVISFAREAPSALGLQQAHWVGLGVIIAAGYYAWRVRPTFRP